MVADVGRNVIFTWNTQEVLGVRTKNVARSGPAVNVTSDEDGGFQTVLGVASENACTVSLSGVTKSDVLAVAFSSGARTGQVSITWPSGRTLEGTFYMQSYNEGVPYNDAVTFDAELISNGTWTEVEGS